jgi:hypothetical protein
MHLVIHHATVQLSRTAAERYAAVTAITEARAERRLLRRGSDQPAVTRAPARQH